MVLSRDSSKLGNLTKDISSIIRSGYFDDAHDSGSPRLYIRNPDKFMLIALQFHIISRAEHVEEYGLGIT